MASTKTCHCLWLEALWGLDSPSLPDTSYAASRFAVITADQDISPRPLLVPEASAHFLRMGGPCWVEFPLGPCLLWDIKPGFPFLSSAPPILHFFQNAPSTPMFKPTVCLPPAPRQRSGDQMFPPLNTTIQALTRKEPGREGWGPQRCGAVSMNPGEQTGSLGGRSCPKLWEVSWLEFSGQGRVAGGGPGSSPED